MLSDKQAPGDSTSLAVHRQTIYRHVLSIVGNPDDAEDLTQEAFLRAHAKRSSLADPAKLLPWLYRIATNVCYDRFRKSSFQNRPRSIAEESGDGTAPTGAEPAEEKLPRLDKLMEQDEMGACVQKYLLDLPDTYRAVMLLHDVLGLTNAEVADMLGISLPTAKIRLHRGRERLRKALSNACSFATDERGVVVCEPKPVKIKL